MNETAGSADLALVLGAGTLVIGGVILIILGFRARRELTNERAEVIARSSRNDKAAVEVTKVSASTELVRGIPATPMEREVGRRLAKFGIRQDRARSVFLGLRLASLASFAFLILVFAPSLALFSASPTLTLIVAAITGAFGWFLPALIVFKMDKDRVAAIAAGLPDALDLLVICTGAGLALEDGIERVSLELRLSQPALADELMRTSADLKVLSTSEAALAKFADRVNIPAVRALVTTLSQTMRYGTPLAQAMRVVAAGLRSDALFQMEERANKLPALMTVPMIALIIPTIFLILGGPAALRIIDIVGK